MPDGKKVNSIEFKILMCIKDKGIKGANAYQDVSLDINVCKAETNTKDELRKLKYTSFDGLTF